MTHVTRNGMNRVVALARTGALATTLACASWLGGCAAGNDASRYRVTDRPLVFTPSGLANASALGLVDRDALATRRDSELGVDVERMRGARDASTQRILLDRIDTSDGRPRSRTSYRGYSYSSFDR